MLKFLQKCNISNDIIDKIKKDNSSANVYNLNCNEDEVCKIIDYLKEIKITCVEQLLVYRIDMFFGSLEDIKSKFSKYEINSLVQAINNDYTIIDEL